MTAHNLIGLFTQYQLEMIESIENYVEQNTGTMNVEHLYPHLSYNVEKVTKPLKSLQKTDEGVEVTYTEYDDLETHTSNLVQFSMDELWQIIYALNK